MNVFFIVSEKDVKCFLKAFDQEFLFGGLYWVLSSSKSDSLPVLENLKKAIKHISIEDHKRSQIKTIFFFSELLQWFLLILGHKPNTRYKLGVVENQNTIFTFMQSVLFSLLDQYSMFANYWTEGIEKKDSKLDDEKKSDLLLKNTFLVCLKNIREFLIYEGPGDGLDTAFIKKILKAPEFAAFEQQVQDIHSPTDCQQEARRFFVFFFPPFFLIIYLIQTKQFTGSLEFTKQLWALQRKNHNMNEKNFGCDNEQNI